MSELGLREITGRAASRALPPKKWAKFLSDWASKQDNSETATRNVTAALLHHLVKPHSPSILVTYLQQALADELFTAREFAVALLVHLHRSEVQPSTPVLASIATALISNPTGLNETLPSPVVLSDVPDVGTSASAEPEEVPALVLLLPLLRQCASAPAPAPLHALAARLTTLIPPIPAPPFEAGLEAAQISSLLPEDVAKPLRECLAGLMADLPLPQAPAPDVMFGNGMGDVGVGMQMGQMGVGVQMPVSAMPLRQAAAFLIEYGARAHTWERNPEYASVPRLPHPHHRHIIQLGRALTTDSQAFIVALFDAAADRVLTSWSHSPSAAVRPYVFFTEALPVMLRWWRDNADPKWPYPADLQGALQGVITTHSQQLSNWFQAVNSIYTAKFSQSEPDEEGYVQPDGWSLLSLEATAVRRYVSLGLLEEEAATELIGSPVKPASSRESLMERLATTSPSHLPALETFITYASGATSSTASLGAEVATCITDIAQKPAPENLFVRLAGSPSLMVLIAAYISPSSLLDIITENLLDRVEDQAVRQEDPQSSLIRFGAGVVLAETLCAQFKLPLPHLLWNARRVSNLEDLTEDERGHLNGWVKALFGSDGIDDEILLKTSPQGLCRLASTLVQQSIVAASSGQIDLDTLHSGLSYFAQPLLSWCLGCVVGWLCAEIERLGQLSGVHLNVLQTLVLDSAFPEPLLRANAHAMNRLLEPTSGLEPVIQSSGFDAIAVRARLQAVGGPDGSALLPDPPFLSPLPTLRSEIQAVRHIDIATQGWESRLLDAVQAALRAEGSLRVLDALLPDIVYPSVVDVEDPITQVVALICALHLRGIPLSVALVNGLVPSLFAPRSPFVPASMQPHLIGTSTNGVNHATPPLPYAAHTFHRLLRSTILAVATSDDTLADQLAQYLAEEFAFQSTRPTNQPKTKRMPKGLGPGAAPDPGLVDEQKALLDELISKFESDDEFKGRFPTFVNTMAPKAINGEVANGDGDVQMS